MSGFETAVISVGAIIFLIYCGMHIAVALTLVSFVSVWAVTGNFNIAVNLLSLTFRDSINDYIFGVIPPFVLMGMIVSIGRIGNDIFDVAQHLFRRVTGGLGIATVAANAVFAAITGISIASAAVFTRLAVPEMIRHGYAPRFAVGIVAGSSVLGMLIPPSLLFVLYGALTEQSVGALFIAGILPGVLLGIVYCIGISLIGRFSKKALSTERLDEQPMPPMAGLAMAGKAGPVLALVGLVLGGIYGGIFTPTEAGAVGALGALIIALAMCRLTWGKFWSALLQTGQVTAAICILIISSSLYARMLAMSGLPAHMANAFFHFEMSTGFVIVTMLVCILLLGTLLDSASTMLITVPIVMPILLAAHVDLIWLGVLVVLAVEVGLLTPPLGISVYVIKASLDPESRISLSDIFVGASPFVGMMLLVILLVYFFPWLATGLL